MATATRCAFVLEPEALTSKLRFALDVETSSISNPSFKEASQTRARHSRAVVRVLH